MVVDELFVKKGTEFLPIDSLDNQMIDEIVYEGETLHFAKQKDLTGTNEIIADNGVQEPIISLEVSGNTTQKTYEGYNLLNKENFEVQALRNETAYTGYGDVVLRDTEIKAMLKQNTTYTITAEIEGVVGVPSGTTLSIGQGFLFVAAGSPYLAFGKHSNKIANEGEIYTYISTFTTPSTFNEREFRMHVYSGQSKLDGTNYNATCIIRNVQITEGAEAKPYQPYVGGESSPNPSYPQPIENANDSGMSVTVRSPNLFEFKDHTGSMTDDEGNVLSWEMKDGILTVNGKQNTFVTLTIPRTQAIVHTVPAGTYTYTPYLYREEGQLICSCDWSMFGIGYAFSGETGLATKTFERDFSFGYFSLYILANFEYKDYKCAPALLKGEYNSLVDLPLYSPYFEPIKVTIPASVEVDGVTVDLKFGKQGEKADKLIVDKQSGKVTYEQWVKTEPLPITSATWGIPTTANQVKTLRATTYFNNSFSNITYGTGFLMNKFKEVFDITLDEQGFYMATGGLLGWVGIRVNRDLLETQDTAGIKKWLQTQQDNGDPVVFNHALKTPITHDITNTDLGQSLLALATGKGTNYLEISSDLAPSKTDLSYWRQIIPGE